MRTASKRVILALPCYCNGHTEGTLHAHLVMYGSLSPKLLQAAANHETLSKHLAEALNSMYKAEVSLDTHAMDLVTKWWNSQEKDPKLKIYGIPSFMCLAPQADNDDEASSEELSNFDKFVENVVVTSQMHGENHSHTCHKGKEGRYGCREGYPAGSSDTTHPLQLAELDGEETEEETEKGYKVLESITAGPRSTRLMLDKNEMDPHKVFPEQDKRIIIWEIKRPLINKLPELPTEYFFDADGTLQGPAATAAEDDTDLQGNEDKISRWINNQFRDILTERSFATISDHILSQLECPGLIELFKYVSKVLPERNLSVVQFNPTISALTGSNTAVYHLGSETQSVNALCYIAPYMTKNKVPLLETLTSVAQARKDIEKRPSQAEDSGTEFRTVAHLVQRTLNRMDLKMEISDMQLAGSLLGMKSMSTSDIFTWYNGASHILAIRTEQLKGKSSNQYKDSLPVDDCESLSSTDSFSDDSARFYGISSPDCALDDFKHDGRDNDDYSSSSDKSTQCEEDGGDKHHEEEEEVGDDNNTAAALLQEAEESFNSLGARHTCTPLYNIGGSSSVEKVRIPVPYPDLYRYRGKDLCMLNRMEYTSLVNIVKAQRKNTASGAGRPMNPRFEFGDGIAIKGHFAQILKSKQAIIRHIGKIPSKPKKMPSVKDTKKYRQWRKHANKFAEFFLSYLRPETDHFDDTSVNDLSYSYETLCSWLVQLRQSKRCIDKFRLATFERNLEAFQTSKAVQKCTKAFRFRNRTIWSEQDKQAEMVRRSLYHDARGNHSNELEEDEEEVDGIQYTQQDVIRCTNQINTIMRSIGSLRALLANAVDGAGHELVLDNILGNHTVVFDDRSANLEATGGTIQSIFANLNDKNGVSPQEIMNLKNNPFSMETFEGIGSPASDDDPSLLTLSPESYLSSLKDKTREHIDQCNLTVDKRDFVGAVNDYLCRLKTYQTTKVESYDPAPLKLFLSGGPGTGKSYVIYTIQSLISRLNVGKCQSMSFMGVAAGLTDGVTTHSFAKINVVQTPEEEPIPDLIDINKFTTDIGDLIMIIIDEISQTSARHLAIIHARLVQALGLGAANKVSFIFVGDFNQQLAIMGKNLASGSIDMVCSDKHIVHRDIRRNCYTENSPQRAGIQLFLKGTQRFELKTQNRSNDQQHNEDLVDMYENGEITSAHLSHLRILDEATYQNDPSWLRATVIVRTNHEIKLLEHVLSEKFARATGNIVIRWKMKKVHFKGIGADLNKDAYDERSPELWQYFVKSADAYLSQTINNSLKLSNGTRVRYHSLTFRNLTEDAQCKELIENASAGDVVDLPHVPLSVNVQLFVENTEAENIEKRRTWSATRTLVQGDAVIPICASGSRNNSITCPIVYGQTSAAKVTSTPYFAIDTAFAMTSDKCEGRTMGKIILGIARSPHHTHSGRKFDMASFFVSLSRAKTGDNIRVLPCTRGCSLQSQISYLQGLRRQNIITKFLQCWTEREDGFMQFDEDLLLSLYQGNTE